MTRVAVAGTTDAVVAAGVRLAEQGGNAVDSALASLLVAMVVEPGIVSLGGGAYVTVGPADGSAPVTVDGGVEMPGRGLPPSRFGRGVHDVTSGYGGGLTMTVGYGSVATPGAVPAVGLAHGRYGRVPWREVVAPAHEAARDGFALSAASSYYLAYVHDTVFGWQPDSRAVLHDDNGHLLPRGSRVHVPDLADSLALLADEGTSAFSTGEVGRRLASDMAAHEGLVTAADLAAYTPRVRPALTARHGPWSVGTNPPPSVGGPVLVALLRLMGDRPAGAWTDGDVARLVEVSDAVLRWRHAHLDLVDLTDAREAVGRRLVELTAGGSPDALRTSPDVPGGRRRSSGSASTVTVSVVDADGGACAATASSGYGSGLLVPGTGVWLNNCLGEPELNRTGLHALPAGERLPSNMAPTVGRRDDGAVLAVGSPGADRITTALAQVLLSHVHGGMPLQAAVARPRLHVHYDDTGRTVVDHEEDLVLPGADVLALPTRAHHAHSMYFGGVAAALRHGDGGLEAAADPRREGATAVSP